jgi:hypothetical protein
MWWAFFGARLNYFRSRSKSNFICKSILSCRHWSVSFNERFLSFYGAGIRAFSKKSYCNLKVYSIYGGGRNHIYHSTPLYGI